VGEEVIVSGWIENIRDHGGVLFLDLRDNTDIIQVVSNDDSIFSGLTKESVIKVTGVIRKRNVETFNSKIHTGEIELLVSELVVLGKSKSELPFEIISSKNVNSIVSGDTISQAQVVLQSLGYSQNEYLKAIETALSTLNKDDSQELIKEALKILSIF
jgi:aspartyl/asparaginyl-tRNA synthetase